MRSLFDVKLFSGIYHLAKNIQQIESFFVNFTAFKKLRVKIMA